MIAVDPEALDSMDPAPLVGGLLEYNRWGLPHRAAAFLDCFPGDVSSIAAAASSLGRDGADHRRRHRVPADGLVETVTYGDGVGATPRSARRPTTSAVGPSASGPTGRRRAARPEALAAVTGPVDQRLVWDAANNLVAQIDDRDAGRR
ncbi:MAG: hypothetical protein M5U28_46455 [Sandaracinaceae bacterium]|nr:hypothetical protein [Sandaracinaceae bacterium]